jgi:hypothetical protein
MFSAFRVSAFCVIAVISLLSALVCSAQPVVNLPENASYQVKENNPEKGKPAHFLRELYFYPFYSNDSFLHEFDQDSIVKDATTRFPKIDEMSGIAINLYWSQLCPAEGKCNFAMIDQILGFWENLGKKVILCVATTGTPIERLTAGKREFVSATPGWVLAKSATYQSPSNNFTGLYRDWKNMANNPQYQFTFPRYDDPYFVAEIHKLVISLGERYDGNPAISYMRIGTGKSGEDNPYGRTNGFGHGTGMPGFTNSLFITFSRKVTDFYLESFRKTRLEFDIGWTAIVAAGAKTATPITANEPKEAQEFLDYVIGRNIFIAFNGIGPQPKKKVPGATAANHEGVVCPGYSAHPDRDTSATDAAPYAQVARLRQKGISFGLEGNALSDPCEAPQRIGAILEFYRPVRVVFMGDAAALINFLREGVNDANRSEVESLTSMFVPWTKSADLAAHQTEATPRIKQFAGEVDRVIGQSLVGR